MLICLPYNATHVSLAPPCNPNNPKYKEYFIIIMIYNKITG